MLACAGASAEAEMVRRRWGKAPKESPSQRAERPQAKPPTAYVAKTQAAPKVDGDLADEVWTKATVLRLERTLDGSAGAAQPTEVRLLRDEANLYVACRCSEPLMNRLTARTAGHDADVWGDDSLELFIGPGRGYYHFAVNPVGATYDARVKDRGWNSGFRSAAAKGVREWTAEMAIPLGAMAAGETPTEWIANFNRNRRTSGALQESAWSPTYSGDSHVPARFGKLLFQPPPPEPPAPERPVVKKDEVTILPAEDGEGVVRFDLSALPRGAGIHRAELLVFRSALVSGADDAGSVDIEVYPLFEEFGGGKPAVSAAPLALRGPWFDRFDATEAVRKWGAGKPNGGFYVKVCPYWNPEGTCLDVAYEGKPDQVPPQVSGLKVLHRAGQTFITFNEVQPLITAEKTTWGEIKKALAEAKAACSYRIYAHAEPISADNLHQAELLGEVGPLSAYNVNARNKEYLIGQAMIESDEIGELAEDFNGRMHQWHMDSPRMDRYPVQRFVIDERAGALPVGTGLYVHHPGSAGRRYYAMVCVRDGVENTKDISEANALRSPVDETVGTGVPVRQGKGLWGPYFDYPGTRWVYVQWCAPPLSPRPNMYFNWSVLIPPKVQGKAPAELYFHPDGYSYAQPGKKMLLGSIQIAPHDYPPSGWYGFNDACGTLKSFKSGTVGDHTQRRIVAFLDWAQKELPIDPDRIMAVGADGAAGLALSFPDVFACVRITGFDEGVLNARAAGVYADAWGPKSPQIKDGKGRGDWAWADLDKLALEQTTDLPLFMCAGPSWGRVAGYAKGRGRFYSAMQEARQPLQAGWGWSGAGNLGGIDRYTGEWRGRVISRDMPIPAVANSTRDRDAEDSGLAGGGYSWRDLKEEADSFSVTLIGRE
ncbi:MAG: hypothetical protein AMJ81_03835, partial [Phycisphaerae bacterium SM23_33]